MRRVALVILLIGAAFLGGAFVNGPGLQWAQSRVLRLLGLNSVGEIAAVDLETNSSSEIGADSTPIERLETPIATPISSAASDEKSFKKDPSKKTSALQLRPKPTKSNLGSDQPHQSSLPSATTSRSVTKSPSDIVAPLDQNVLLASGNSQPQSSPGQTTPSSSVERALERADNLPDLLPPGQKSPVGSIPPPVAPSTGRKPIRAVDDEWTLLESKMQTLGVSRFTIEGKPGGAIVFACLVPVAGHQAVAERFEAEGNDVIHAAQSVLRRIVLWRATQSPRGE